MNRKITLFYLLCAMFFFISLAFSITPPYQTSGAVAGRWTTDLPAAINLARTNENYVVIFYGSSACSLCTTAMNNVFNTSVFYNWSLENRVPIVYASGGTSFGASVRAKYLGSGSAFYPTIIFVDGATDTKIKSTIFRSSGGYSTFQDFIRIAPELIPKRVCSPEICNGIDDDCDGQIDEGLVEICNGIDDDCDGLIDEGMLKKNYYFDLDGDGFGAGTIFSSCDAPWGVYVLTSTDCNDSNPNVRPGAFEACDGVDNDCDGIIDEGFECVFGSANCNSACQFETRRINSCTGSVIQNAVANILDNKYSEKWNGLAWVEIENKNYFYSSIVKDCTYKCALGYYNLNNVCVPYACNIGDANLTNSILCIDDNIGLISPFTNELVSSCSELKKCEYVCKTGYYLGIVNGKRECISYQYQCTGEVDPNSVIYEGDDAGLTINTSSKLVAFNSLNKCEYHCKKNFILNDSNTSCIPNPFVCVGADSFDSNAVLYLDDNSDLTQNTFSTFVSSNTSAKCEYYCRDGYYKGSGVDENKCLPNIYYCIGEPDLNSVMCQDDNTNLDSNTPISLSLACSSIKKCEWVCKEGFKRGTGTDQNKCVPEINYSCIGPIDPNANLYEGDSENISSLDNMVNILSFENTSLKCEWHCKDGYYLADSNTGYVCVKESVQSFFCTGLVDSNSLIINGDASGLDSNYEKVLVDFNTSRKCEYVCRNGYYLGSISGVSVCLPNIYSCKGSIPFAAVYINDDSGLTSDMNVVLVESNTPRKCEYHCVNNYYKSGNSCIPVNLTSAVCGNAEKSFAPNESFPGSYSLCDVGTSSITNPTLSEDVGSIVEWNCVSDISVNCSATRVSSKYVPVEEDDPKNSILKVTSVIKSDGNIEVTLKCLKTTVVDLSVSDYLSDEDYALSQTKFDCGVSESTHQIQLDSALDVERTLIIRASFADSDNCTTCELDYFIDYNPSESTDGEDNSIWFIILGLMVLGIIVVGAFLVLKNNNFFNKKM